MNSLNRQFFRKLVQVIMSLLACCDQKRIKKIFLAFNLDVKLFPIIQLLTLKIR